MNCFMKRINTEMNKKLPDNVYVLGHEYSIEEMTNRLFKEREAYGDCDNEQRKIRVYCGVASSVVRDTLLHEILHAAWNLLYLDNEKEEKIVSRLATLMVGFFDDPRNIKVKNFILTGEQ
jgi:hypothetical protein